MGAGNSGTIRTASWVCALLLAATVSALCAVGPSSSAPSAPAPHPVPCPGLRVAAEWEPVTGVLIGWPLELPQTLVVALAEQVDLYVTVCNCRNATRAREQFAEWGIDPGRVHLILTQQGTGYYITRDWGPLAVFDEQGKRLVDGRFRDYAIGTANHHGLLWLAPLPVISYRAEDRAPLAVARALDCPITEVPLYLTGGNLAFDGRGTAFATRIILDENRRHGISSEKFLEVARQELGVQQFYFVPNFERLGIQHLDCLLKLLDEERILVKRAPPDHPSCRYIERAVCYLSGLTNVYGRPYQILRIDTPCYRFKQMANYTNALIVNRSVFVPLFGIPADAAALDTWRAAMPGYEVRGFEDRTWHVSDALHCRVRGVWDSGMLYLTHRRMDPLVGWANQYTPSVHIRDYSGAGLVEDQLHLAWRTRGNGPWRQVPLLRTAEPHLYRGSIEGVPPGEIVEYYFAAASCSGRRETLPRTAPGGVYTFATVCNPLPP